jgi:nucleoside-diphosphate-sugar epimerase
VTDLTGARILVTGPTGQVGLPVALALAEANDVVAVARFGASDGRERLEEAGVTCVTTDFGRGDLSGVPADVDHVCHFAVAKTGDWDRDLAANVEALGMLMHHCREASSFLHCSSTAVYQPNGHHDFAEGDPLGDNHRPFGFLPTYSINKIAAEAMARYGARQWGLPTTIARLSVPYGDNGGWPAFHFAMMLAGQPVPVHEDAPSEFNPIHEDDIVAQVPRLLAVASVPATVVNWAGPDVVSIEDWCLHLGELVGIMPTFAPTSATIESVRVDTTRMDDLIGPAEVRWRDGMRRMVEAQHPELFSD